MPSKVQLATALAKAKVAVRKRKAAAKASEDSLVERIQANLSYPTAMHGKDGRDAPTLSQVVEAVTPLLPEAKVEHTETTIVEKIKDGQIEDIVDLMLTAKLPEIRPEDRPAVEQITIDVSDEKLEGFVSKEDFDKALVRIQRAIQQSSGGGGGSNGDLVHVIQVSEDTTITSQQLLSDKYNVVLVMSAGITVTLPIDTGSKIIEVKQGFVGTGTYTICKESS